MLINIFGIHQEGIIFWMPENDKILSRTYSINDLKNEFKKTKVNNTVLVQAAPSNAETEYMLGIADSSENCLWSSWLDKF